MNIGDWVHASHKMNKITGFIITKLHDAVEICVTVPHNYGNVIMWDDDVLPGDDTIWMDDIPTLIDLSLEIGDREWFSKWTHELSLWKKASDVLPQAIDANESA